MFADFVVQPTGVTATGSFGGGGFIEGNLIDGLRLTDPLSVETNDPVPTEWSTFETIGDASGGTTNGYNAWRNGGGVVTLVSALYR